MLLAIDIGNTNIHNGIFKGKVLKKTFTISTCADDLSLFYRRNLKGYQGRLDNIIVVSVVPKALKQIEGVLRGIGAKNILVVGRDVDSGVKNLYKNPRQVGQDRLVNARAAYELYGGECIIVDFGTAVTIDVVDKNKQYLGGVIAPGAEISLWALSERTALLPKVSIRKPQGILGLETSQSMIIGTVCGLGSLCDGIIDKIKKRYCKRAMVIATGGLSRMIGPYCKRVKKIDPELTLKGLQLISESEQFFNY